MKEEGSKGVTEVEGLKLRNSDASVVSNQQPSRSNPSMNDEESMGRELFSISSKSIKLQLKKKKKTEHPLSTRSKKKKMRD